MIRAILDTNVVLSALRSRNGASFEIMKRLELGEFTLLLSNTVLAEYEEILKRELVPLGFSHVWIEQFLDELCLEAQSFKPSASWKPALPDPDDEPLAQLAMESKIVILSRTMSGISLQTGSPPFAWLIPRLFWT